VSASPSDFPIRRNTLLLAATLTCLSGTLQLVVAVATTTLVLVTGVKGILGLGPAIFLTSGAIAALPAGRAMDRFGRMPVIVGGFAVGIAASIVVALGCLWSSSALVVFGFMLLGVSQASIFLARAAGADMYPPERRGRGISYVLFGAVLGAALGPLVWRPVFEGKDLTTDTLVVPWLIAAAMMCVGLVISLSVRPDPKRIGEELGYGLHVHGGPAAPLSEILRRPGVLTALLAAVTSFAVMVSVMNLSGAMLVGMGHSQADTFWVISAHIVGMYGLVLFVGDLIDRMGRRFALVGGLLVMALSTIMIAWVTSVAAMSVALFGLGLGWIFSYVAATSELVDRAALSERGRLVGLSDQLSSFGAAALVLSGGAAYDGIGVGSVAYGAALIAAVPAFLIVLAPRRPPAAAEQPG
jgi:MFS family permease